MHPSSRHNIERRHTCTSLVMSAPRIISVPRALVQILTSTDLSSFSEVSYQSSPISGLTHVDVPLLSKTFSFGLLLTDMVFDMQVTNVALASRP